LVGFTKAAAAEVAGKGITVNAVCPGWVDTDMAREGFSRAAAKTGRPVEEIATQLVERSSQKRLLEPKEVADLYDLRSVLDGHAGVRAANLARAPRRALVDALRAQMAVMTASAKKHDVQRYYAANLAFHWAIVEAADNDQLALTYRGVVQQLHLSRLKNLSHDIGMQASMTEHQQIAEALGDGDADRSRALLAEHVTASYRRLVGTPKQG